MTKQKILLDTDKTSCLILPLDGYKKSMHIIKYPPYSLCLYPRNLHPAVYQFTIAARHNNGMSVF